MSAEQENKNTGVTEEEPSLVEFMQTLIVFMH